MDTIILQFPDRSTILSKNFGEIRYGKKSHLNDEKMKGCLLMHVNCSFSQIGVASRVFQILKDYEIFTPVSHFDRFRLYTQIGPFLIDFISMDNKKFAVETKEKYTELLRENKWYK